MRRLLPALFLILAGVSTASAWSPVRYAESLLTDGSPAVIGHNRDYVVGSNETLMEIAVKTGVGFDNLCRANPDSDPWHPQVGSRLILPLAFLPPDDLITGITINLAEMRLYLVWSEDGQRRIRAYPLGIGRDGWETPPGDFRVTRILRHPSWTPPPSLRKEKPDLPAVIPPGPDNPLGEFWIGTSAPGIGLHGTNQPFGVGRRVSHGCLRLYPRDIRDLVTRVKPGMPLRILNQPVKISVRASNLYLESHAPPLNPEPLPATVPMDRMDIHRAILAARGIPLRFSIQN
ncbi:peptidoglycan L,D-transpeptidase [Geothermobacter hydrogeniphilus]|uniref:Peptidoglycan L,D-transpeptidase n=1 Tax=Geothermobacter hydrogeniphilus TaxID=1969733 RepID=A0A1X0Y3H1_9BACT|nr:peptidoglycan L,D-transpeptidase [Geothermobacter hydrogeniphilus]